MELTRVEVHDIKNQLAITIGMIELVQKVLNREGKEADLTRINERLEKAAAAQKKMQLFFENADKMTGS